MYVWLRVCRWRKGHRRPEERTANGEPDKCGACTVELVDE
eukprot:COSAG02_NODE_5419_length_4346_cov_1.821286_7_plen_40_part_00